MDTATLMRWHSLRTLDDIPAVSELEQEYLAMCNASAHELSVLIPKVYKLDDARRDQVREALAAFNVKADPSHLDISGAWDISTPDNLLVFVAAQQFQADTLSCDRTTLLPLLRSIYTHGISSSLFDFALHETLIGRMSAARGELDLQDVHLFPYKFSKGPYQLSVSLDTPAHSIRDFVKLNRSLRELLEEPKQHLLEADFTADLTKRAISLRSRLGSLSRYHIAAESEDHNGMSFMSSVNTVFLRDEGCPQYWLYTPLEQNALVHFGKDPFNGGNKPKNLTIIDGSQHEHALHMLVNIGAYDLSREVTLSNSNHLTKLYEDSVRRARKDLSMEYENFHRLQQQLSDVSDYLDTMKDKDRRREYAKRLPPEILEFVVCPSTWEPALYQLLGKLSWNASIRKYHDIEQFAADFTQASGTQRQSLLQDITSGMHRQQYNDVNAWLYRNHREECERSGVRFSVR